jgi:hypothetical protein
MKRAVIFGGYGTFGTLVARELARLGVNVVIGGRDRARAEALADSLGPAHRGTMVDVTNAVSCRAAVDHHAVAVNCAGPFGTLGPALLDACLEVGCHYADITDDRAYTQMVRSYSERFRQRGLAAVYGCSSLPGISGALALAARGLTQVAKSSEQNSPIPLASPPQRARVTLFIGNNNPKGVAAVGSLLGGLGKPISAPQGMLRGFHDREVVSLPRPFGARGVFNFNSPEYDLFPELLGVQSVSVKVGFELRLITYGLRALAGLSPNWRVHATSLLESCGDWFRGLGTSGGAVMTELFWADCSTGQATISSSQHGQRMAALPCAFAAHALCEGKANDSGALTVYDLFGAEALLQRLTAEGFELVTGLT